MKNRLTATERKAAATERKNRQIARNVKRTS